MGVHAHITPILPLSLDTRLRTPACRSPTRSRGSGLGCRSPACPSQKGASAARSSTRSHRFGACGRAPVVYRTRHWGACATCSFTSSHCFSAGWRAPAAFRPSHTSASAVCSSTRSHGFDAGRRAPIVSRLSRRGASAATRSLARISARARSCCLSPEPEGRVGRSLVHSLALLRCRQAPTASLVRNAGARRPIARRVTLVALPLSPPVIAHRGVTFDRHRDRHIGVT